MRSIYIVDDDDDIRASLHTLLSVYKNTIIRGFPSGDAFLAELDELTPGPLLLDMNMPGTSGMEVIEAIDGRPDLLPIILTGWGDVPRAVLAMKAGAVDFLEKPCDPKQLLDTVETAFSLLEKTTLVAARADTAVKKLERLSGRERDVLEGLMVGKSNKIIGHELGISPRTVEVYRANMMEKLEVPSLPDAMRIAFFGGLLAD
ncbi:response regulator transcription factor [Blastomonas aquatica]|uniref:Transcriptional regulatory protein FixJ n=1 Tax=Blastomonas aquatica TaxID=1510276 RepID=A0ABQ1JPK6_9SPHN|nr:response regulator [Blastomonas aquatica]GGB74072.1 transcriptional regulatory protein FixJ [Blastomonas aquatica]